MANPKYFNNSKTHEWIAKMIPVMIRWAKSSHQVPHYYSDLSENVGLKTNQIGHFLGSIQDVMVKLGKDHGTVIPTLNALVASKSNDLPSDSFDYCVPNYSSLSIESKKGETRKLNEDAHNYDWEWVLKELDLEPAPIFSQKEQVSIINTKKVIGHGGEGEEHKRIKEYIKNNPKSVGITQKVIFANNEQVLSSNDELDVYFILKDNTRFAVEVKPSSAPESDILRGIFQCVKYKAVLEAMRVIEYSNYSCKVLLVIGGSLSSQNRKVAGDLRITVIENFRIP